MEYLLSLDSLFPLFIGFIEPQKSNLSTMSHYLSSGSIIEFKYVLYHILSIRQYGTFVCPHLISCGFLPLHFFLNTMRINTKIRKIPLVDMVKSKPQVNILLTIDKADIPRAICSAFSWPTVWNNSPKQYSEIG